jgi:SHS2 domain-containing protein
MVSALSEHGVGIFLRNNMDPTSGFREIPHTADWALQVWAPDLAGLFAQSAAGMYWLMETALDGEGRDQRTIHLEAADHESLLVGFLSELLYLGESEGLGVDRCDIQIEGTRLSAVLHDAPVAEQKKEIKAVTFHNLRIVETSPGYEVTIVFDV